MFQLSNIRSDDPLTLARAEVYLLDNPDPGVRMRPSGELQRAMETGQGLLLSKDGEICGISLVYQFDLAPSGPVYSEIGTMRVTANGYDLQTFLAKFHLLQLELEEYGSGHPAVFAVVTPNTASEHNLRDKVGMAEWMPPPELALMRGSTGVPFSAEKKVLIARGGDFAAARADLRAWHDSANIFRTPKNIGKVVVTMKWFEPGILVSDP